CNAGDVAAGTGKALNKTLCDRIEAGTRHNDRNRLGCILGRSDPHGSCCCHDDIYLEPYQFSRTLRVLIELPLRISVLGCYVLSFYIAKLPQSQSNPLGTAGLSSWIVRR